jgi:hypothetical protein
MQAKRSLLRIYLKTGSTGTIEDWSLIGDGFTTNTISYEPESDDLQYINQDTASTALKRYKPTMNLEGVIEMTESGTTSKTYTLNPVFAYINELRRSRSISNETEILIVELYTGTLDTINNVWENCKAQEQKVNIQVEDFGGDAGETITYSATVNFNGDPIDSVSTYSVVNTSAGTLISSANTRTVTYTTTNVTHANQPTKAYDGMDLNVVLTASSGYVLPSSITVEVGSTTLSSSTDYTWNNATGRLKILGSKIDGNVTITATGASA